MHINQFTKEQSDSMCYISLRKNMVILPETKIISSTKPAKPFLKWAGGKNKLIPRLQNLLPSDIATGNYTYVEPFVGSGAVLFWMLENFPHLSKVVMNDVNVDLINAYQVIASAPHDLLRSLELFQNEFHELEGNEDAKKHYYYEKRTEYNLRASNKYNHAALFIFLNRTCFNGLYRVNRKNEFNVPMGAYARPKICDVENILAVSHALQRVEILCGDFEDTLRYVGEKAVFYLDPPYKPLNPTSSFNAYAQDRFDDAEQVRLKNFCQRIDGLGHTWFLSNSDLYTHGGKDEFFDSLYSDFLIERVEARRNINVNPLKRGVLNELLITNSPARTV